MSEGDEEKYPILKEFDRPDLNIEHVMKIYGKWANNYTKDVVEIGYLAPRVDAEQVEKLFKDDKDVLILDCACGTGLAGLEMFKLGFHNLHGLDASPEMLEEAKKTGVYKKLMSAMLGLDRLDIEDNTYDAVVICGAVGQAHVKATCFGELIRVVKPGGYVIFDTCDEDFKECGDGDKSFDEVIDNKIMDGSWVTVTRRPVERIYSTFGGRIYVLRVK